MFMQYDTDTTNSNTNKIYLTTGEGHESLRRKPQQKKQMCLTSNRAENAFEDLLMNTFRAIYSSHITFVLFMYT